MIIAEGEGWMYIRHPWIKDHGRPHNEERLERPKGAQLLENSRNVAHHLTREWHWGIWGREGIIEYVNPAFTKTTGFQMDEAIGKHRAFLNQERMMPHSHEQLWSVIHGPAYFGPNSGIGRRMGNCMTKRGRLLLEMVERLLG